MTVSARTIGVLAVQGDFRSHRRALEELGHRVVEVRTPADLAGVEALVLPGGESTAISKLLQSSGLFDAIAGRLEADDLPVLGTCAGMILSAVRLVDGTSDQRSFGIFNAVVRRNGIGPQSASCEADLAVGVLDEKFRAIFIRPPVVDEVGEGVEVLARWRGKPVLCSQGSHLFTTFHPELTGDGRIHQLFVERLKP